MGNQTFVDQVVRFLNNACPYHGAPVVQTGVHPSYGLITECPRKDCTWQWMGELPSLEDNVVDVAQQMQFGFERRVAVTVRGKTAFVKPVVNGEVKKSEAKPEAKFEVKSEAKPKVMKPKAKKKREERKPVSTESVVIDSVAEAKALMKAEEPVADPIAMVVEPVEPFLETENELVIEKTKPEPTQEKAVRNAKGQFVKKAESKTTKSKSKSKGETKKSKKVESKPKSKTKAKTKVESKSKPKHKARVVA